jgi:hypothetical protein
MVALIDSRRVFMRAINTTRGNRHTGLKDPLSAPTALSTKKKAG